ncbi:uncharacterized protein RHOBADRAFT_44292, partial [Rhodotorula graminis WP1]
MSSPRASSRSPSLDLQLEPDSDLDPDLLDPQLAVPIPPPHIASSPSPSSSSSSSSSTSSSHDLDRDPHQAPGPAPTPASPHAQVSCLAHLNADADDALVANQAYQHALKDAMMRLEHVRRRAKALKDLVTSLSASLAASTSSSAADRDRDRDRDAAAADNDNDEVEPDPDVGAGRALARLPDRHVRLRAPGMLEPAVPYFRHMHGQDLPLNEDARARERYLRAIQARSWQTHERLKLKGEVVAHNHRLVAREAMLRGDDPAEAVASRRRDDPGWFMRNVDGLDWDSIALVMPHRSAAACKIQWQSRDHPFLASLGGGGGGGGGGGVEAAKWTADEHARLVAAPNRTPTMCARRWRRRPKPSGTTSSSAAKVERMVWTPEEDERLKVAVQQWGENWDVVARHISVPAAVCRLRFQNSLRPSLARGRFTPNEDALL